MGGSHQSRSSSEGESWSAYGSGGATYQIVTTPTPSPLVVYGSNVADATLTTAADMSLDTESGNETSSTMTYTYSASGQYGEIMNQPSTTSGVASIPATPTGNGWVFQPGPGLFTAGNWSASVTLSASNYVLGLTITIRFFRYSGGTYTLIGSITTPVLGTAKTTYTFSPTFFSSLSLGASDYLYTDLWWFDNQSTITGDNPVIYLSDSASQSVDNDMQVTTAPFAPSLVLYGSSVADTMLPNACDMVAGIVGGTETSTLTTVVGGGYNTAEIFSQGGTSNGVVAIPATPTGHGWVYKPGPGIFAGGNWSASITQSSVFGSTHTDTVRFFRYSGGVYTLIGSISVTHSGTAKAVHTFATTPFSSIPFGSLDLLYIDLWFTDLTGVDADNPTIYESNATSLGVANDMQITTAPFGSQVGQITGGVDTVVLQLGTKQYLNIGAIGQFSLSSVSDEGGLILRSSSLGNHYRFRYDGAGSLSIARDVNGTVTPLVSLPFSLVPGTWYSLRAESIGSYLATKVWIAGTLEPAGWQLSVFDSTQSNPSQFGLYCDLYLATDTAQFSSFAVYDAPATSRDLSTRLILYAGVLKDIIAARLILGALSNRDILSRLYLVPNAHGSPVVRDLGVRLLIQPAVNVGVPGASGIENNVFMDGDGLPIQIQTAPYQVGGVVLQDYPSAASTPFLQGTTVVAGSTFTLIFSNPRVATVTAFTSTATNIIVTGEDQAMSYVHLPARSLDGGGGILMTINSGGSVLLTFPLSNGQMVTGLVT